MLSRLQRRPRKKLKQRPSRRQLASPEKLEIRLNFSAYYDLEVLSQTGGTLSSILSAASINDSGKVAFVASTSAGQAVYVADSASGPQIVSFAPTSTRTYGQELQINNTGYVGAVDVTGSQRRARIWNTASPGSSTTIASSSVPRAFSEHFDAVSTPVALTNDGQLAFAGLESPTAPDPSFWEIHLSGSEVDRRDVFSLFTEVVQIDIPPSAFFRQAAADGDRVVVSNRQGTTTSITWYDITGLDSSELIASTASGWSELGIRPGISDDGDIVVFTGNKGDGLGVYACIREGSALSYCQ